MLYADGNTAKIGDVINIDGKYTGVVIACIDDSEFLAGYAHWAYLKEGLMIDTDFGGLVQYTEPLTENIVLAHRANSGQI